MTRHPVELAVWCNEEGCRFPVPLLGSGVWAGQMSLASAYAVTDRDGRSVREELLRANIPLGDNISRQPVKAAFEVHIEQGPVLEQYAKTIGIVTGVQHMCRYEMIVRGQEAHAGPTPMNMRRDPVRVLADRAAPACIQAAAQHGDDARLTIGIIETQPKSSNTVPGTATLHRRLCATRRRGPYRSLRDHAERIVGAERLPAAGSRGEFRCAWESPGVAFNQNCIDAVRTAAAHLGYSTMEMVQWRRPRLLPYREGRACLDDLRSLRGRLEPQRGGEREACRPCGGRQCAPPRNAKLDLICLSSPPARAGGCTRAVDHWSALSMSIIAFHSPVACFLQITRNLPVVAMSSAAHFALYSSRCPADRRVRRIERLRSWRLLLLRRIRE